MNFVDLVNATADRFEQTICGVSDRLQLIPTEDFGWSNMRWFSSQFRLAHLERFQQPKFSVLHLVIWPHVTDPSPIFGFDIIATDVKVTGIFYDLSPTLEPVEPFYPHQISDQRERPEWGDIFSEHWVAARPDGAECVQICDHACAQLERYLKSLGKNQSARVHDIIQAQNRYSMQQRKNFHTTRVLLKILGTDRGTHFVNNVLFPTI